MAVKRSFGDNVFGQTYHPITDHLYDCDIEHFPPAVRHALDPLQVRLEHAGSHLRARISWIGDWWFSLVDGRGVVSIRGDKALLASDYVLLYIALSGQNRSSESLSQFPRPGEMMLLPWRKGGVISMSEYRYILVHVPKRALLQDMEEMPALRFRKPVSALVGAGAVLYASIRALAEEAGRNTGRASLPLLLPGIARQIRTLFSAEDHLLTQANEHPYQMKRVISYLQAHLSTRPLSADQVAVACGLSKRQLFRAFAEAGDNFAYKLRRLRVEKARDLLAFHPEMPLSEIARATGFSSASHFCTVFRSLVGTTPLAFRRRQSAYHSEE